jgi:hypothetical protein
VHASLWGQVRGNGVKGKFVDGWAHWRVGGRVHACARGEMGGQEGVLGVKAVQSSVCGSSVCGSSVVSGRRRPWLVGG